MTAQRCETCGREPENGTPTHWLGCERIRAAEPVPAGPSGPASLDECEHGGCSKPKKEWSGKGAKPKYCAAGHKKEK